MISNILAYADAKFRRELAKCQLLCVECHRAKTIRELGQKPAEHGSTTMYRRGCRCSACRLAASEYQKTLKGRMGKQASHVQIMPEPQNPMSKHSWHALW
jgi:hypothetical protein